MPRNSVVDSDDIAERIKEIQKAEQRETKFETTKPGVDHPEFPTFIELHMAPENIRGAIIAIYARKAGVYAGFGHRCGKCRGIASGACCFSNCSHVWWTPQVF